MEASASLVSDTSAGVSGTTFALNFILAGSLSLLWGLINSL